MGVTLSLRKAKSGTWRDFVFAQFLDADDQRGPKYARSFHGNLHLPISSAPRSAVSFVKPPQNCLGTVARSANLRRKVADFEAVQDFVHNVRQQPDFFPRQVQVQN
jgi:hypothetical protein